MSTRVALVYLLTASRYGETHTQSRMHTEIVYSTQSSRYPGSSASLAASTRRRTASLLCPSRRYFPDETTCRSDNKLYTPDC